MLCVPATLIAGNTPGLLPLMPLLLQMAVVIAAEQLTTAYKNRCQPGSDPHFWARRYTFVSAIAGATWGLGALFWFVPGIPSPPRPIWRWPSGHDRDGIHRPLGAPPRLSAAHTVFALGPLVALLLLQGGLYADMTAILVVLFRRAC